MKVQGVKTHWFYWPTWRDADPFSGYWIITATLFQDQYHTTALRRGNVDGFAGEVLPVQHRSSHLIARTWKQSAIYLSISPVISSSAIALITGIVPVLLMGLVFVVTSLLRFIALKPSLVSASHRHKVRSKRKRSTYILPLACVALWY